MNKTERMRQVVSGMPAATEMQQKADNGWKMVAIEWERQVEAPAHQLPGDVPFGLQISPETRLLEDSPLEREALFQLMDLILQEGSYARIADEMNRRGFYTRDGSHWTPVSVFEMLPRMIEVGPHLFRSSEWQKRKQRMPKSH